MKRKLFTLCSAISLLLCVAVCGLWVRSASKADVFTLKLTEHRAWWVETASYGQLQFVQETNTAPDTFQSGWVTRPVVDTSTCSTTLGFGAISTSALTWDGEGSRWIGLTAVIVPVYAVAVLATLLPAIQSIIHMRQRRAKGRTSAGLCPACGYDLRATPGRCPECGTLPAAR